MKRVARLRLAVAAMLALGAFAPRQVLAQVPPRFYWKTLSNANAVPVIGESLSGNTNPFDPAHTVWIGADDDAQFLDFGHDIGHKPDRFGVVGGRPAAANFVH